MTSLMPKKRKLLDASKLSVIKDDVSESNASVSAMNDSQKSDNQKSSSSRL